MRWVAVLLAVGCTDRVELPEVPIEGGTARQREVVRQALLQFDEQAGPGRVVLRSARILDIREADVGGRYSSSRLKLDETLDDQLLAESTFHELCHALDFQQGVLPGRDPLIDELTAGMKVFDPDLDPLRPRHETLARFCALGPVGATVLAEDDDPFRASVGEWLLDHLWGGPVVLEDYVWEPRDSVATPFQLRYPQVSATDDRRVVHVQPYGRGATYADLYTGEQVVTDLPPVPGPMEIPPGIVGARFDLEPGLYAGWREGPAVGLASWPAYQLEWLGPVMLYHDGENWRRLRSESAAVWWPFVADDQLWLQLDTDQDSLTRWASLDAWR